MTHPVYARLTGERRAFDRHTVLHELAQRLERVRAAQPLAARVRAFVERGVPYFAPADAHYRQWAERAAELWDALDTRLGEA